MRVSVVPLIQQQTSDPGEKCSSGAFASIINARAMSAKHFGERAASILLTRGLQSRGADRNCKNNQRVLRPLRY